MVVLALLLAFTALAFATFVAWDVARRWVEHKQDAVRLDHRTNEENAAIMDRLDKAEHDIRTLQRTPAAVKQATPSLAAEMVATTARR